MKKIKILGYGEIGKSLHEIYKKRNTPNIAWKDLEQGYGPNECDILNVCLPFDTWFIPTVITEAKDSGASIVIIHSTVKPGTTRGIAMALGESVKVVHSPVIGVHPNLAQGILTFPKWIGYGGISIDEEPPYEIIEHFYSMGLPEVNAIMPFEATELFKLFDTTYYGLTIAFNADTKYYLDLFGIDYEYWVEYNKKYNRGYASLGMENVARPYYEKLSVPIGGHCIVPNAKILKQCVDIPAIDQILKFSDDELSYKIADRINTPVEGVDETSKGKGKDKKNAQGD